MAKGGLEDVIGIPAMKTMLTEQLENQRKVVAAWGFDLEKMESLDVEKIVVEKDQPAIPKAEALVFINKNLTAHIKEFERIKNRLKDLAAKEIK